MRIQTFQVLIALCFASCTSYSQNDDGVTKQNSETTKTAPHRYGGWYCPDNLNGFPAVDITEWKNVPVVNGRMATQEETQSGKSLIFVDAEKYPNAKALDIPMPKLASFYSDYTKRDELIIVIQAINVDHDSIVGFRYLNGGNGSARLNEIRFLANEEIALIPSARFVSQTIEIKATQEAIWNVLTQPEYTEALEHIFDKDKTLSPNWRKSSNVNYHYQPAGNTTSSYGEKLFGNYYIQNDYDGLMYTEKFLLLENQENNTTELKIVCGPFGDDFEAQKHQINKWAKEVKALSEKK